jgi:hypothetical protein
VDGRLGIWSVTSLLPLLLISALAAGCGEEILTAEEFVQRANDNGASLQLGQELVSDDPDKQIYAVTLEPPGGEASAEASGEEHAHGSGSIAVLRDTDAATAEVDRCRTTADLVCFQAGNIALRLEGGLSPAEVGTTSTALQKMAE